MPTKHRFVGPITLVVIALLLLAPPVASAGTAQPSISAEQGLGLYQRVDAWVRAWDTPVRESQEAASEPVCVAVVTLRLDGRVFGRGAAASADPSPLVVWEATSRALTSANTKLTSERDAMWEAFIKQLAERLTITVEFSDRLIPISPNELALPGFGYSPGSMGVAVRRGDQIEVVGAESMLMRETDMAQSAKALANALSDSRETMLESPQKLAESGYAFYRFAPLVLAQPAPGLGAAFVDRGGRVIEASEISVRSIRALSDRVADHLMSRRWAGVERFGLAGTLDPVTGRVETPSASPFEQALGAYALLRHGARAASKRDREAIEAARQVLRDLAVVDKGEATPWEDPLASCMTLVALGELDLVNILGDDELNTLRLRSLETLDTLYSERGGFAKEIPAGAWGLVAHALVRSAKLDPVDRAPLASSAISRAFLDTPASGLVTQMPFLAWAQLEQAGQGAEIPAALALTQMRELVWEHQLRRDDLGWADRDLAGGIVFTSASAPLPSWVALRPLAALATMLGDERLTPGTPGSGEIPVQISRLTDAIRFVRQLAAEGEIMHLYASAGEAQWGVRMALWDQRMPVEVDAMALLMLSETNDSFAEIMNRAAP